MLNQRISFYIPSTQDIDSATNAQEFNNRALDVAKAMGSMFGGFTISNGHIGGWVASNGQLVTEEVKQVVAYTDKQGLAKHGAEVKAMAKDKAKEWGQEAISLEIVEVKGGLDFIG